LTHLLLLLLGSLATLFVGVRASRYKKIARKAEDDLIKVVEERLGGGDEGPVVMQFDTRDCPACDKRHAESQRGTYCVGGVRKNGPCTMAAVHFHWQCESCKYPWIELGKVQSPTKKPGITAIKSGPLTSANVPVKPMQMSEFWGTPPQRTPMAQAAMDAMLAHTARQAVGSTIIHPDEAFVPSKIDAAAQHIKDLKKILGQ
jgi:hypothetical protein